MRAEDLEFNKEFIEMVEGAREKYKFATGCIKENTSISFDELINLIINIENIENNNTFCGWSNREKYLFGFGTAAGMIEKQFENMELKNS